MSTLERKHDAAIAETNPCCDARDKDKDKDKDKDEDKQAMRFLPPDFQQFDAVRIDTVPR